MPRPDRWNRQLHVTLATVFTLVACDRAPQADAYGTFEAEEVVVASEAGGRLERFSVSDGQELQAAQVVGVIDTVQLAFERAQVQAQRASLLAQRTEMSEQRQSLRVQREIAGRTRARIDRLFAQQAATAQQRDQVERDARVLAVQVDAAAAAVDRTTAELASLDARVAALDDRIRRASQRNPVAGTVLVTFVRAGEVVQPGQPLYRIANLDSLTLRAYVTGAQLTAFRLGDLVTVNVSGGEAALRPTRGRITWVSTRAEFTPTPVQTRDERGELVYAIKVRVANHDGTLKIGMPADVTLGTTPVAGRDP